IMAVDNDKAGKDFIQTMKCFVDLKEDIPTNEKDWNDVRKKQVSEQQAKETAQPKKMKPIKEVERSV
ncbi:hypothetical protein CN924_26910, partial [Bacillus cereus]